MSYEWWQKSVRSSKPEPVNESDPQEGFFRIRLDGKFVPLAIWWQGDRDENGEPEGDQELVCIVGFGDDQLRVDPLQNVGKKTGANYWVWASKNPITEARYRHAMATGHWDDIDPVIDQMNEIAVGVREASSPITATEDRHGIGGNQPPETDALKDQIEAARSGVKEYAKITNGDVAAKAQTLRSHLLELGRTADKRRDALKRPHLDANTAIDAEWMPLVKSAKAGADAIAEALSEFFTEQDRIRKEEERKATEAQHRAEEEARKAAEAGKPAPPPPPLAPAPAPAPTQVKGGSGRAANIKPVKVVTAITDWEALWAFFKTHPDLRAFMEQLAQRAVNAGHEVPGVTVEEKRKVA